MSDIKKRQTSDERAVIEAERRERIHKRVHALICANADAIVDFIIDQDLQAQQRIEELSNANKRLMNGAEMRKAQERIAELESKLNELDPPRDINGELGFESDSAP